MLKDFLDAYQEFWIKATDFKGFTSRADWWFVQLANLIISLLTIPIFLRTFGLNVYGIVCIIPQIAILLEESKILERTGDMDLYKLNTRFRVARIVHLVRIW